MNRFVKRLIAGIVSVAMLTLTACSGNSEGDESKENEKGRYLETEYTLPKEAANAITIGKMADGTLRLVTSESILDSADGGETWEISALGYTPKTEREDGGYLYSAAVNSKGRLLLSYNNGCYLVDESGTEKELIVELEEVSISGTSESADEEFENMLYYVEFTADDKVVGTDINGRVYIVDPDSGETIQTFGDEDSHIECFAVVGNRFVALASGGIDIYNVETGALEEPDSVLSDYFRDLTENENWYADSSSLVTAEAEDTLYYADETGLYRYTFGAGEMEQLINGSLCSLSNPSFFITKILEMEDNTFLILYGDSLMHYEYSEEVSTVPSEEIRVYALEDNESIRQAISNFQAKNPDYFVNLEVGMSGDDSVTVSDAISTLNTNIMAGDGPDVILLDKLPIDSYIETGLLEDLSDVVDECMEESSFYENILNYKQSEDGLYAIPTQFSLPVISGTDETMQKVSDLTTFKDEIISLRAENPDIDSVLGQVNAASLIEWLLTTSLPDIVKDDGTLDRGSLTEFLEAAKEIYKANYQPAEDEDDLSVSGMSVFSTMMGVLNQRQKMSIINIEGMSSMETLVSMNDQAGWSFRTMSGLSEKVFIPQDTVGISAKSEDKETAKVFIKYLLSMDNQSYAQASGFPVNADALGQIYDSLKDQEQGEITLGTTNDDGESEDASLNMRSVNEAEYNILKGYIEAVDTAAVSDAVITEAIVEEGAACLTEDADISACVDKVLQSVNLHLAE
ncbi:MAG: extracellular solute-binding protein [Lachnospiraceae bacterium]